MTKASAVAEAILRDRERRKSQAEAQEKSTRPRATIDFDPFEITRWRVIAGPDPSYLPKTPMRRGPVGWFINCGHCNVEFESKVALRRHVWWKIFEDLSCKLFF